MVIAAMSRISLVRSILVSLTVWRLTTTEIATKASRHRDLSPVSFPILFTSAKKKKHNFFFKELSRHIIEQMLEAKSANNQCRSILTKERDR